MMVSVSPTSTLAAAVAATLEGGGAAAAAAAAAGDAANAARGVRFYTPLTYKLPHLITIMDESSALTAAAAADDSDCFPDARHDHDVMTISSKQTEVELTGGVRETFKQDDREMAAATDNEQGPSYGSTTVWLHSSPGVQGHAAVAVKLPAGTSLSVYMQALQLNQVGQDHHCRAGAE
jgi:hypothetical protein